MKKSIFDIGLEYLQTIEELENYCLERETDEAPDFLLERLEINKNEMAEKMDAYARVLIEMKAQRDALDFEISRLDRKKKAIENTEKVLKERMAFAVGQYGNISKTGTKQFKTDLISVSFIRTFPVTVKDVLQIPREYTRVKIKEITTNRDTFDQLFSLLKENGFESLVRSEIEAEKTKISAYLKPQVKDDFGPIPEDLMPGVELDTKTGYVRIN